MDEHIKHGDWVVFTAGSSGEMAWARQRRLANALSLANALFGNVRFALAFVDPAVS